MFLVFDQHKPARYRVNTLYVYLECQLDVLWLQLREDCNGHCNPHVVEAIRHQVGILNTHTRYLHDNVLVYADRILKTLPGDLDVAMFSCTGTEANELALRIARHYTEGTGLIVTEDAYHGNSHAIAEISTEDNEPEDRSDYIVTVPAPDTYRGPDKYQALVQ